jgi:hypothetical protein
MYSDQYKSGSSQDKGKACADAPSKPTDEKKKKNHRPTQGKPHVYHALVKSALDYPHFEIAHPILTLAQRISDFVPLPLESSPAPHSSHTVTSFRPLGGLTICMVKAQKPRREPGTSPYPIFHKAKDTLAECMDVVPTIQTIKNLEVEIQDRENVTDNTSWAHPAIWDIETDYTRNWEAYINSDDDEPILPQAPRSASTPELAPSFPLPWPRKNL